MANSKIQKAYIQNKFSVKSYKAHFVNYTTRFNTFRFFDPTKNRVVQECNAKFSKNVIFINKNTKTNTENQSPDRISQG